MNKKVTKEKKDEESGSLKEDLVVVGTGIRTTGQLTTETLCYIEKADRVFHVVGDPIAEEMIRNLNPKGEMSLRGLYAQGKDRLQTYQEMVVTILDDVREGKMVVAAFYGHPGVFAWPSHESVKLAKAEGYRAVMLPGISAEDCLFADLNIDPATHGCQSYEATDFLMNGRIIDPSSSVILWQIGVLANWDYKGHAYDLSAMPHLIGRLAAIYPMEHIVYVYEASTYFGCEPRISPVKIADLGAAGLTPASTLYIPPSQAPRPDPRYSFLLPQMQAYR